VKGEGCEGSGLRRALDHDRFYHEGFETRFRGFTEGSAESGDPSERAEGGVYAGQAGDGDGRGDPDPGYGTSHVETCTERRSTSHATGLSASSLHSDGKSRQCSTAVSNVSV